MSGISEIKTEFLIERKNVPQPVISESDTKDNLLNTDNVTDDTELSVKRIKLSNEINSSETTVKSKQRGQNKARPKPTKGCQEIKLCPTLKNVPESKDPEACKYTNCRLIHDTEEYLKYKEPDILTNGGQCHLFESRGFCQFGLTCRFASSHLTTNHRNIVDKEKYSTWINDTLNTIQFDVQVSLQRKRYSFKLADQIIKLYDNRNKCNNTNDSQNNNMNSEDVNDVTSCNNISQNDPMTIINQDAITDEGDQNDSMTMITQGAITDEDVIRIREVEKKKIDWNDKLYLSPLTTVGNLPFRRICKEYGADVTCGEMALCESLLKGLKQEWALVKRHSSEDLFGVQICGYNVYIISKTAQIINDHMNVDFVDLNLGCPIELIYKKGAGCGMLHRPKALQSSISCASELLQVPFTVKTRVGVYQNKNIAHKLVPKFAEWGASLITVHGRSMEQRYTKFANWEYIEQCAQAAKPCPVYGNGDILSYQDYLDSRKTAPSVKGVMIGRGALIKPWIFTEVKTQKLWDISSSERFDILKKYANYGLEHWGCDTMGVENTRRFMLEWLSFLYRYIPVGLLEKPPQKINNRPPTYFGRDDMETLMASSNCSDWIKISEMLLGPIPDGFNFLPKHRANSY